MKILISPFTYVVLYVAMWHLRLHEYPDTSIPASILTILQAVVLLLWIARAPRWPDVPQSGLLFLLLMSMFISAFTSGWAGGAIDVFNRFVPTILSFLIIAVTADSIIRLDILTWTVALALGIIGVHGILEWQDGIGWSGATPVEGSRITYVGLLADPNDLGMALLMALPLQIYLIAKTRIFALRVLLLLCIIASLWSTYLTNSRGTMLGLVSMTAYFVYRRFGAMKALLLVPIAIFGMVVGGPGRVEEISADEESAAGRVDAWYAGFEMLRDSPLFGVGMGNFVEHHWLTAHNSYILAMAELGLVGYLIWISLLTISIVMLWRIIGLKSPDGSLVTQEELADWHAHQDFARALLLALIAFMVTAFFLSRSYLPMLYMTYGLCAGLDMTVRRKWPTLKPISFGPLFPRLFLLEIVSILALRIVVRLLL